MFGLYKQPVLTDLQLTRLGEHKYLSSGSTLLDPLMQRFWNWFVTKVPLSIAPNVLTVTGLIVNAVTTLILILFSPDAKHEVPSWTLFLFAVGLFVYQTLDAIDGKQARRTGSSSPLGELFDHGCDSLSTLFVALATVIAVRLGQYPTVMFYQCIAGSVLFYTAHWQTYVSGILQFGRFDVTEAQFTIMGIHLISALFGSSVWSTVIPLGIIQIELRLLLVIFTLGGAVTNIFCYLWSICYSGGKGKNGSTIAGTSILSPLSPISSVIAAAVIIYIKSPTNLYESNPCLYLLTFGLVIAKVTNKLVIAHMTKHEVKTLDTSLVGPGLLILNQYFNVYLSETFVLWLAFIWTLFDLVLYSTQVCKEISSHLSINVFSIKPRLSTSTVQTRNSSSAGHSSGRGRSTYRRGGNIGNGQSNEGDGFTEEDGQEDDEDAFDFNNESKSLLVPSGGKLTDNLMDNKTSSSPFKPQPPLPLPPSSSSKSSIIFENKFDPRAECESTVIDLLVEPSDLQTAGSSCHNFNSPLTISPGINANTTANNTYCHQSELEGLSINRHSENIVIEVSSLHHHTTT